METRVLCRCVHAFPCIFMRAEDCSSVAPCSTLNQRSGGNSVVRISEIIYSCSEPKEKKNQYSVGVKFLSELRGRLSVRWLSMLVPTGQQLTLIAEHYCGLAQDILRYSYRCALCVCVYVWLCVNVPLPKPFSLRRLCNNTAER